MKSFVVAFAFTLSASTALAQGNGTTGGGEGVYVNGQLVLRDFVDPSTCTWIDGYSILSGVSESLILKSGNASISLGRHINAAKFELDQMLSRVGKLNWYFELMMRREIRSLDFCFTMNAIHPAKTGTRPGKVEDTGIMIYLSPTAVPAGLRVRNAKEVYVQGQRYEEFGPKYRASFIIHEALHTFMDVNQPVQQYYSRLFTLVKAIGELEGNPENETYSFQTTIEKTTGLVPATSQFLWDQDFLRYVFENQEGRRRMILDGTVTLNELIKPRSYDYLHSIPLSDRSKIEYTRTHLYDELFQNFCTLDDQPVLTVLKSQETGSFKIVDYCVTVPGIIEKAMDRPELLDSSSLMQVVQSFYTGLSKVSPSLRDGRVTLSREVNWISGNPAIKPKYRIALELRSPFKQMDFSDAESHLHQHARIMLSLSKVKTPEAWLEMVKQGNLFRLAFNFKRIEAELNTITTPISDEKQAAINNVRAVYRSAVQGLVNYLNENESEAHAEALIQYVNEADLGFKVKN